MRECVLLALAGCLLTKEGPVVVSEGEIIAMAVDDLGIVWAEQVPGEQVTVWAFERGALMYKLNTVEALDRLALVRHVVYWSSAPDARIVGADGTFLVAHIGAGIEAFDPSPDAPDHDPWKHTYPATGATATGVGHGRVAIGAHHVVRTFELGSARSDVHAVGAHAPTLVHPVRDGVVFADHDGLFTTRHGQIDRLAEAASWAHVVEHEDVLYAATDARDDTPRFVRIDDGVTTALDPDGVVTALAVGAGHVYYATSHEIHRVDPAPE